MKMTEPFADYPHIRKVGPLYFLAGQGCRDPETNQCCGLELDDEGNIMTYNIADQTIGVLHNVERVLKSANLDRSHIVDVQVFLTNMDDFSEMNRVWNEFFLEVDSPTRTTVAVKGLPGQNFVEMKVIAAEK